MLQGALGAGKRKPVLDSRCALLQSLPQPPIGALPGDTEEGGEILLEITYRVREEGGRERGSGEGGREGAGEGGGLVCCHSVEVRCCAEDLS